MSDTKPIDPQVAAKLEEPRMKMIQQFVDSMCEMNNILPGSQCFPALETHLIFLVTLGQEARERTMTLCQEMIQEAGDPNKFASFQDINDFVTDFLIKKEIYKSKGQQNESSEINPNAEETSQASQESHGHGSEGQEEELQEPSRETA